MIRLNNLNFYATLTSSLGLLGLFSVALAATAKPQMASNKQLEIGRRIYMEGILASGKPLQGKRAGTVQVEGAAAACETCHRHSGMGSLEGNIVVPPITGRFLFATDDNRPIALVDAREPKNVTRAHLPYTEKSLAKAIRNGVHVGGRALNPLMPQYDLTSAEIKAVMAYLRQLSANLSPGVGEDSLHFATIITPDVDTKQREAMLGMMRAAFTQRNATQENYSGRMRMPIDLLPRTLRNWQLSVWELKGEPATWDKQLADYYRQQPVFAVLSGLGNTTWAPVHSFCQQEKLPCLLPSIPAPPTDTGFYSLYYSGGTSLEARALATHLHNQDKNAAHRLVQVYRDDAVGQGAAQSLTAAFKDSGIQLDTVVLSGQDSSALTETLKSLSDTDALMLWLRPADLANVQKLIPENRKGLVYVSGTLAEENYGFVTDASKANLRVVYPYELGEKRTKNVDMLNKWLKTWRLPLVNEAFQSEVLFNLLFLTDLTSQMLDNLYRDYLIERAEDMLSIGANVSAYPRLSLARGQRFASKGAYIARFGADNKLVADSEWLVP